LPEVQAIAVVVVTHHSSEVLPGLAETLNAQLSDQDELVLIDNASGDQTVAVARECMPRAQVIENPSNLGFAAACHVGAEATRSPLLLFLNPDCRLQTGCIEHLRAAGSEHPDWGAWQAVVMLDQDRVNSSGGVVHYLGIGWAGDCERQLSDLALGDREVAFASGAAMVVRREVWAKLDGMDSDYFMYGEDLDFGLRLWLAGQHVGLAAKAKVLHSYEFDKGLYKWFFLERNRWRTLLSVYPVPLLLLLSPALVLAEFLLLAVAARQGWLSAKLRSHLAVIGGLPRTLARRRSVQGARRIPTAEFAAHLSASVDSPYLGAVSERRLPAVVQSAYWTIVRRALGLLGSR
jgi:N-acetylglucosaminyl-diphospho-decaprenol L-rhamnosyltransferase